MKKLMVLLCGGLCVVSAGVWAQDDEDPKKAQLVEDLMTLPEISDIVSTEKMNETVKGLLFQMGLPVTEELMAIVAYTDDDMHKLKGFMQRQYYEMFSAEELTKMKEFHMSEEGRSIAKKLPALMASMGPLYREMMDAKMAKLAQFVKEKKAMQQINKKTGE